jgi:hypothetical protein
MMASHDLPRREALSWLDWVIIAGIPASFWEACRSWHAGATLAVWHFSVAGTLGLVMCPWLPWPDWLQKTLSWLLIVVWVGLAGLRFWLWWSAVPVMIEYVPSCEDCVPV